MGINVGGLTEELNNKADIDAGNVTSAGVSGLQTRMGLSASTFSSIENNLSTIQTSLSNLAKESTSSSINTTVGQIKTAVDTIKSDVSTIKTGISTISSTPHIQCITSLETLTTTATYGSFSTTITPTFPYMFFELTTNKLNAAYNVTPSILGLTYHDYSTQLSTAANSNATSYPNFSSLSGLIFAANTPININWINASTNLNLSTVITFTVKVLKYQ